MSTSIAGGVRLMPEIRDVRGERFTFYMPPPPHSIPHAVSSGVVCTTPSFAVSFGTRSFFFLFVNNNLSGDFLYFETFIRWFSSFFY